MRILFASSAGAGHFTPLTPWLDAAIKLGHEVLVVGPDRMADQVHLAGYPFRAGASPTQAVIDQTWQRIMKLSKREAAPLVMSEVFCRLHSGALLPAMRATCDEWAPDLVLREPAEFASAVAAEERGIRHVRVGISLAQFDHHSQGFAAEVLEEFMPGLPACITESAYLTRFPESFDPSPYESTLRYRVAASHGGLPDWWGGRSDPLVYVTFGTEAPREPSMIGVFHAALRALDSMRVRVLLTVGRDMDPAVLEPLPPTVHIEPWVDQADILGVTSAVVSHGGSGTVLGALAAGVPQVVVPLFADQSANARRVHEVSAGVAVEAREEADTAPRRVVGDKDVPRIRAAVEQVLESPRFAHAAMKIAAEMSALPTVEAVLAKLITDTT